MNEQKIVDGDNAEALLKNPMFTAVFAAIRDNMTARELACNTANEPNVAADIIRCKQLLFGIERELTRLIESRDAEVKAESVRIEELGALEGQNFFKR